MHSIHFTAAVADAQRADRLAGAARLRSARSDAGPATPLEPEELLIRAARAADRPALDRLRQMEGRPRAWAQGGDVLVALIDGALVAAVGLARLDDAIADPFRRTAGVVELLRERARQLSRPRAGRDRRARPVLVRAH